MNKAGLAEALANKVGLSKKEGEAVVEALAEIVTSTLVSGGTVNIAGFGQFSAKTRKGRIGVNPQNPSEKIQIPSVVVPKFKAGKGLKDALKGKGSTPAPATNDDDAPAEQQAPSFDSDDTFAAPPANEWNQ